MADQRLGAITDQEGDFLINPEKPVTWEGLMQASIPDEIPDSTVRLVRRLSLIAMLGASVIRLLRVDKMPVWFLMLLASDIALASLVVFLLGQ